MSFVNREEMDIGWYMELIQTFSYLGPLVERPSHQQVTLLLAGGGPNPLTFILNANLLVNVKLVSCK